jgi:rubrerythrin
MLRGDEEISEGLLNAFQLEKGAQAFYLAASEEVKDPVAVKMFRELADVEEEHMRSIYDLYNALLGDRGPTPFDEFKEQMPTEYTESGKTIESVLSQVSSRFFVDAKEVLKLALREEISSRDLYLRMAKRASDPGTAALYRDLSEDEEKHIAMIKKALLETG